MTEMLYLLTGIIIGCVFMWFIVSYLLKAKNNQKISQIQSGYQNQITDLEKIASGAEARIEELRQMIKQRDSEITELRDELTTERQQKVEAFTKLEDARKSFEEQRNLIDAMKTEMTDTFNALSAAALKSSSEDFLRLASEHLGKVVADTKGKLGEHQAALDGLIKPLNEALKRYEEQIHMIEVKRKQDYTSLDEQIKLLATTHRELQKETINLVTALRKPHIRGRWGEITLRNVVELAGMSAHCDFTEQVTVDGDTGRLRPDMIIHLPGGHDIVVDSKVSLEALLEISSASSEDAKKDLLKKHASHVKEQINRLSSKAYWNQFSKSPELAVLFLGESALVSALEVDPTILEESMSKKVLVATPTTLFALLTAVAYGWRQEQVTKNAEIIAKLGKELYERINVWAKHCNDISSALSRAVDAHNKAVGSMELRVLPAIRKFKELGIRSIETMPNLKQIDQTPRNLSILESEPNQNDK